MIAATAVMRFSSNVHIVRLREQIGTVIRTDTDYTQAVSVFGKVISGDSGERKNAISVLSKEVFGFGDINQDEDREF